MKDKRLSRFGYEHNRDMIVNTLSKLLETIKKTKGLSTDGIDKDILKDGIYKTVEKFCKSDWETAFKIKNRLLSIYQMYGVPVYNKTGKLYADTDNGNPDMRLQHTLITLSYNLDSIWVFRNCMHFKLENVDVAPVTFNQEDIKKINSDMIIDLEYNGRRYYIEVIKSSDRMIDKNNEGGFIDWYSINLMTESKDIPVGLSYTFGFVPEKLPRVFGVSYEGVCHKFCNECSKRKAIHTELENHKSFDMCRVSKYADDVCICYLHELPAKKILDIVYFCIECYLNADKLYEKRSKISKNYHKSNTTMVSVNYDNPRDSYRTLPVHHYKYELENGKPYDRSEWKGGHHASPVAHVRRAHVRRCKNGYLVYEGDGNWRRVPKGQGTHVWVNESHPMAGSENRQVFKV